MSVSASPLATATAALTCRALCRTQLHHGLPAPQGKLLQVMNFYFQIRWWCWDDQAPHKRQLRYNTKQRSLISCSFSLWDLPSFRDVATPECHPRENSPGGTLSRHIPHIYIHTHIHICVCIYIKQSRSPRVGRPTLGPTQMQVTAFVCLTSHCMAHVHFSSRVALPVNLH